MLSQNALFKSLHRTRSSLKMFLSLVWPKGGPNAVYAESARAVGVAANDVREHTSRGSVPPLGGREGWVHISLVLSYSSPSTSGQTALSCKGFPPPDNMLKVVSLSLWRVAALSILKICGFGKEVKNKNVLNWNERELQAADIKCFLLNSCIFLTCSLLSVSAEQLVPIYNGCVLNPHFNWAFS